MSNVIAAGAGRSSALRAALLTGFALLGALLMFTLEPLVGRLLLAGYGGSFQVWTTCLMFFQALLLVGYLYAHYVAPRIGRGHLLVACLPLAVLPLGIDAAPDLNAPVASVLMALGLRVALPFFVLSTSGVMAQQWLARTSGEGHEDPYYLYAASNAGSLVGLLAYPLLIEPLVGVAAQSLVWSLLYVAYLALTAVVALPRARATATRDVAPGDHVSLQTACYWLCLSAAPAILLMAITNKIAAEIGSVPIFWVLPLALYLGTFVIVFARRPWQRNWAWIAGVSVGVLLLSALLPGGWLRLAWYLFILFALCLVGHGELHAQRPSAQKLTLFYLMLSIGGFVGGAFVGLLAPVIFTKLHEYPLAVAMLGATLAVGRRAEIGAALARIKGRPQRRALLAAASGIAALGVASSGVLPTKADSYAFRNFYGLYFVVEGPAHPRMQRVSNAEDDSRFRYFVHGRTLHGVEKLDDRGRSKVGYFQNRAPYGDVMDLLGSPKKVGVLGLGAGSMAAYFTPDDELVFYELDKDNERIAREHFSFLEECAAPVRVVIGDGRMMLGADPKAPDGYYDAVLADAFSGDGIPVHLLTREAVGLYLAKVKPGGLVVFHISNRYFDLKPVLKAAADAYGLHSVYRRRNPGDDLGDYEFPSILYVMSSSGAALQPFTERGWEIVDDDADVLAIRPWTDDHINVLAPLWSKLRDG